MRPSISHGMLAAAVAMTLGCSDASTDAERTAESAAAFEGTHHGEPARPRGVTVMTRNVYLGFDIAPVLGAPSANDVPVLVAQAWAQMKGNDFAARAVALADEVARARPEVVGLEEVALFQRMPHDGSAPEIIDYLAILQSALSARHLHYTAAIVQRESEVTMPMLAGFAPGGAPLLDGVEMIDRDVVLARADVRTSRPRGARYAVGLPVSVGGASVEIVRGWASVVVHGADGPFRFVATHLEEQLAPPVQLAQAKELLQILDAEPLPAVVAGDFNSAADGSQTPTYRLLVREGLVDAWAQAHPHDRGYTCCRPADLHQTAPLDQRLDIVFVRGPCARGRRIDGRVEARIVGEQPRDRTPGGLWPSDHAGVVATFEVR